MHDNPIAAACAAQPAKYTAYEIAHKTGIDPRSVAQMLIPLVNAGLIERIPRPGRGASYLTLDAAALMDVAEGKREVQSEKSDAPEVCALRLARLFGGSYPPGLDAMREEAKRGKVPGYHRHYERQSQCHENTSFSMPMRATAMETMVL